MLRNTLTLCLKIKLSFFFVSKHVLDVVHFSRTMYRFTCLPEHTFQLPLTQKNADASCVRPTQNIQYFLVLFQKQPRSVKEKYKQVLIHVGVIEAIRKHH